jgi:hypothetical protein
LSKAFTGRARDVDTVRESGLLDFIEPGDEFLAGRGGFINEVISLLYGLKYICLLIKEKGSNYQKKRRKEVE